MNIIKILKTLLLVGLYVLNAQVISAQDSLSDLNLTPAEKQWLIDHPVIRISPDYSYEPVEFIVGDKHTGMTSEYFDLFSEKLGVEFQLVVHDKWSETIKSMDAGRVDMLTLVQDTPQRRLKYNFSDPYVALNGVMITDRINTNNKLKMEDLIGKKLATVDGYFWQDLVKTDYPGIELVPVVDIAEGLQQTALGTADAFLGSFATLSYYLTEQEITNLMVAGKAPYQINFGTAIRKDWPELVGIMNKVIASITDEQHKSIRSNWIKLDYEPPLLSRRVTFALLALTVFAGLLALAGGLISTTLRRKVREKTHELRNVNQQLEMMVEVRTQDLRRANDKLLSTKRDLTSTNRILEEEVNRDGLTRIPNRKRLDEVLELTYMNSRNTLEPLSIIMADIDHFKKLNDHYGHLIGDDCLREVASCLSRFTKRGGEFVARFGGEEFIMVLPNLDEEEAIKYANLVLQQVQALGIENFDSPTEKIVTLSMGVATLDPRVDTFKVAELVERSDKAMYQAKRNGRNQVVAYSSL